MRGHLAKDWKGTREQITRRPKIKSVADTGSGVQRGFGAACLVCRAQWGRGQSQEHSQRAGQGDQAMQVLYQLRTSGVYSLYVMGSQWKVKNREVRWSDLCFLRYKLDPCDLDSILILLLTLGKILNVSKISVSISGKWVWECLPQKKI